MTAEQLRGRRSGQGGGPLGSLLGPTLRSLASAATPTVLTLLCVANVQAGDLPVHPQVNVAMCRGCHGLPGYRTAFPDVYSVPKLGGQEAQYLVKALQDYRSGLRPHATMRSIAATLSDQDIAALAAYYAGSQK